jgi:hypothetical protein
MEKEEVLIQLSNKLGEPKEYLICQELHADGNLHLHCYFKAAKKYNLRDPRFLDLMSEDGTVYHGNYQSVRSAAAVKKYVMQKRCPTFSYPLCGNLTIE